MNIERLLVRTLIYMGAGFVVVVVSLRILLPPVAFEMLVIEGVLEPICLFGLLPAVIVGIPAYLVYRFWKWRKGSK